MNNDLNFSISEEIKAEPKKVWRALTEPEQVKQYFFGTNLVTDWQVGQPIIFQGVWEGKEYQDKGTVLKFEPEKILEFDYWSNFSATADKPENYSVISYQLAGKDSQTTVTFNQHGFKNEAARDQSKENWRQVLKALKEFVEKPKN